MAIAAEQSRTEMFWRVFKIWGGIMALPGALFLLMSASSSALQNPSQFLSFFMLAALYWVIAPGVAFGSVGAAFMTQCVRPGKTFRAFAVGTVVGFATPAAAFVALTILLPKNEATMGWPLFGMIFALTGAFAGIMAATAVTSK